MATHSSILAEKFHGERSLTGYSSWGHEESDMTEHVNYADSAFISSVFITMNGISFSPSERIIVCCQDAT